MSPRFVKSQREMEGRFEDVWVLVDDDDDLETWPEDAELDARRQAGDAAGRPAAGERHGAVHRRRRAPGHAPRPRPARPGRALPRDEPRSRRRPCDARRPRRARARGPVHDGAAIRSSPPSRRGPASPSPPSRPTPPEAAAAGLAALAPGPRGAPAARPRRRARRAALHGGAARGRARRPGRALAAADVRVELTCETPAHVQTPLEPHAAVARWDGDEPHGVGVDPGDLRRATRARSPLRPPARARPRPLRVHRRRVRRQAGRRGRGAARGGARPRRRTARCGSRSAATRTRSSAAAGRGRGRRSPSARRRDGTLAAIELAAVVDMGVGRLGLPRGGAGPRPSTPARTSAR